MFLPQIHQANLDLGSKVGNNNVQIDQNIIEVTNDASSDSEDHDISEHTSTSSFSTQAKPISTCEQNHQPVINLEFMLGNYEDSIMSALDGGGDESEQVEHKTLDVGTTFQNEIVDSDEDL